MQKFVQVALKPCAQGGGQYAIVTLKNDPVNALTTGVWHDLLDTLTQMEKTPSVRGMILQSGLQKDLFTAGNDLKELFVPGSSPEKYRDFWLTQTQFLARLYRSPLVTLAAIRGASPAGGCGIALCCDYRIMTSISTTPKASIGLNEVAIGILVPKYWGKLLRQTAGCDGRTEKMLMFGKMATPEEALKLGLVDELVQDKNTLLATAEKRIQQLLQIPDAGRIITKGLIRDAFSHEWEAYGEEEAKSGWDALSRPEIIKALGAVMKRLSGSKL